MFNRINLKQMKKYVSLIVLGTWLLCTFVGCKDTNSPESFNGNVARPAWATSSNYDFTSSMTAVVKVDLKAQYPNLAADFVLSENDLLGAFADEQCLGIAELKEGYFFMYINGPVTENPSAVTLRYYSAFYKNLFEAKDAFPFRNDDHLGTTAAPFVPALVVVE